MPDRFDEFWTLCPRKKGKGAARKAYAKARKLAEESELIDAIRRFRQECLGKDPDFICHPATWLNQERWEDEPDAVVKADEEQVWRHRAASIKVLTGIRKHARQDVEECYRRNLLTKDEMEAAL
ncbi:MAG: hypothetical protein ACR2RF_06145 [Geminicoccaceae bacterium]